MERVKTGISGLDEALNGGIPKGNVILISGPSGTGKTLLGLSFLYHGATKFNEPGVLVSTDQTQEGVREQAKNFNWNLEELEKKNLIRIHHIDVTEVKDAEYLEKIEKLAKEVKAKRLVIDSLTTLTEFLAPMEVKKCDKLFEALESIVTVPLSEAIVSKSILIKIIKKLKELNCTCLVTSELPEEGNWLSRDTVSEFLTDGIILLRPFKYARKDIDLIVTKLRYGSHSKDIHKIYITEKGIEVKPAEKGVII
ncbi:MAG: ATPase domain-containing protein [Candidatus Aenigmarchaeota archaeon]|nr:ATPase domain-containing protein [Candidatus Aenigmarchaeota archaeon]